MDVKRRGEGEDVKGRAGGDGRGGKARGVEGRVRAGGVGI